MRNALGSFATLEADPTAPTIGGQSPFQQVIGGITSLTNAANQGYNMYTGKPPIVPVQPQTDWSKVALYGGLALLAITLLAKKRK